MLTKIPRGTKDITPDEIYKWHYLEETARKVCEDFSFSEVRFPTFEYTELFARGVGDTTDVVQKEMYTFLDKDERSITLRPEGTASTARLFLQNSLYAGTLPSKLYYLIPCFRYEKPQAGRLREFHQFGAEIFGAPGPLAEVEIITLIDSFLKRVGITDIALNINSLGCKTCRAEYQKALFSFFSERKDKLCPLCNERLAKNPMRIIDCKNPDCKEQIKGMPKMLDFLCGECKEHFESVKEYLTGLSIPYTVDPSIVRGLDYYTRTVFEFVTNEIGAQGTVCGGGRYDNLTREIGDMEYAGIGFAMGLERLLLLLSAKGVKIPEPENVKLFLIPLGTRAQKLSANLLLEMRNMGISAEMDLLSRSVKAQMKFDHPILSNTDLLKIKDMKTGEAHEISISEFTSGFRKILEEKTCQIV